MESAPLTRSCFLLGAGLSCPLCLWGWLSSLSSSREGLPREEPGEEEEAAAEEDSALKLCVPGIVTLQSPLHKAFRLNWTQQVGCAARTPPHPAPSPAFDGAARCDTS